MTSGNARKALEGRRLLGSKGIGRFAASRLGLLSELTSSACISVRACSPQASLMVNLHFEFRPPGIAQIDWNAFEAAKYLSDALVFQLTLSHRQRSREHFSSVSSLRDDWPGTTPGEVTRRTATPGFSDSAFRRKAFQDLPRFIVMYQRKLRI